MLERRLTDTSLKAFKPHKQHGIFAKRLREVSESWPCPGPDTVLHPRTVQWVLAAGSPPEMETT